MFGSITVAVGVVVLAFGWRVSAVADESVATAPTLPDAHQYFESLVVKNDVAALYTANRDGEFIGYINYPARLYQGAACSSIIALTNGARINIDWTIVNKTQASDGQIAIWRNPDIDYRFFHMIAIEGGVVAEPSNNIPKFTLAINDELPRNRLLKAMLLLSSSCRSKSKFD